MKFWALWLIGGIIALLGGVYAFANPSLATLVVTRIIGWTFLFMGGVQAIGALFHPRSAQKIAAIVVGIIGVVIGVWLLANPLAGAVSLTMAVAVLMLGLGIAKIWACLPLKGTGYFWPIALSGAISIVLGLMILVNFPNSAVMVLGTFLAAELVLSGISAISLGWATKTSKAD